MLEDPKDLSEQWRLGTEAHEAAAAQPPRAAAGPERAPGEEALDRPLYVFTVEHLCYLVIASYVLTTRLAALGERPLSPAEARDALFELELFQKGLGSLGHLGAAGSALAHLVGAGLFRVLGPGDFAARIAFALSGLALVAIAFTMRRYVGRAGALALAALIAISPTLTWFSRTGTAPIMALALALLTLRLLLGFLSRPGFIRAAITGLAGGLMLSAAPANLLTATIFLVAGAILAGSDAVTGRDFGERAFYWWRLHLGQVALGTVLALGAWVAIDTGLFANRVVSVLAEEARAAWHPGAGAGFRAGLDFYLPIFALYEFAIVIAAVIGALAFIAVRLKSRFAAFCFIWTVLACSFYLWILARGAELSLEMLLPAALTGALGVDYLYRTRLWRFIRYPLVLIAALGIWVQSLSLVYSAPDASEAPWKRHALLFWSQPATTEQTKLESRRLLKEYRQAADMRPATIFFDADAPVLRWYLRDLQVSDRPADTDVAVTASGAASGAQTIRLVLEERWDPGIVDVPVGALLRYFITARVWKPMISREVTIAYRAPVSAAPTLILTPGSSASAAAAAAATAVGGAASTATPTAAPSASPRTPGPSPATPAPAAARTPAATPAARATPRPTPPAPGAGSPAGESD